MASDPNLIYIAGPISDDLNYYAKFAAVEEYLTRRGHSVLNPARMFEGIAKSGASYRKIMELCRAVVQKADIIVLLPGWQGSKGANTELAVYSHGRHFPRVLYVDLVRDRRSGRWIVHPTHE